MLSPSSFATASRFLNETLPVLSASKLECLNHVLLHVLIAHLAAHEEHELIPVDSTITILIKVPYHLVDLPFRWCKAQSGRRGLKLSSIDGATSISVEEVECLSHLLNLLIGKFWLLTHGCITAAHDPHVLPM